VKQDLGTSNQVNVKTYRDFSKGCLRYMGHSIVLGWDPAGELSYPISLDGHTYHVRPTQTAPSGWFENGQIESVRELTGEFRRGQSKIYNEELEKVEIFKDYKRKINDGLGEYPMYNALTVSSFSQKTPATTINPNFFIDTTIDSPFNPTKSDFFEVQGNSVINHGLVYIHTIPLTRARTIAGNPATLTIDAYNNYMEVYDYTNYLHPKFVNLTNEDTDVWEKRTAPKGSLVLGVTRNPSTGKINWKPFRVVGVMSGQQAHHLNLTLAGLIAENPYLNGFANSITVESMVLVPMEGE